MNRVSIRVALALLFAGGLLWAFSGFAQEAGDGAAVRSFNTKLLEIYEQVQAAPGGAARARADAALIARQRAAALVALMERDPAEALRVAFSADLAAELASAFPGARGQLETHGRWEGKIEYIVEDSVDFKSHRNIRTMRVGVETLLLHFAGAEPGGLKNDDTLSVEGLRVGNTLVASSGSTVKVSANARPPQPPPPPAPCSTLGIQKTIVLMVTMPGAALPVDVTHSGVSDIFFNNSQTALSLTDFWRENSYGVTTAVGAVALGPDSGWYTLDQAYSDTQTGQIRVAAIQAADGDVDFTQYNRLFLVINGMPVTENYAGKGTLGCGNLSSADGTFSASTSWIRANNYNDQARGAFVTIHEGGHNLGLHHANSREFGALALGEPGDAGLLTEYEDIFSEMGRGRGHYAASHKARLGWLPTQVQTVTSNGGYALEPLENLGGALALKIRRGSDPSKWLWVEYRQPTGLYDSRMTIGYNAWGAIPYLDPADSHIFSGGLIHYEDATTGGYSHLLDFTPESSSASTSPLVADDWKDPPLVGTWLDPYTGMSITTSNPTGASLTVDVLYDPTFCARMSPTVSMTPSNPTGKRGQNVTFTVTVLNNDTASCSARAFDMTSSLPGGWSTAFSETPVTIAAGAAASVSMTKTVPSDAALTTYSVNATATNGSNSGTGTASVTVKPGK